MENITTNVADSLIDFDNLSFDDILELPNEEPIIEKKVINNRTIRFSDAPWYQPNTKVIIGGAGGIGSWLSMALSRQECEIYLFDYDIIDEPNMGGQMYTSNDIGKNKVEAISEHILDYSNNVIKQFGKYDEDSFSNNFIFSAFDNIEARKLMFEKWVEYIKDIDGPAIFIDGRLLAEEMQIYAVTRNKIDEYRKYLWAKNEVEAMPCSFKATTHCSMIISGLMVSIYNNYLTNIKFGLAVRELPFRTSFELPTLTFNMTSQ